MREHKFKAWHRELKVWCDAVSVFGDGSWIARIGDVDGYDERECDLVEYTGLKDKNGKEIYEGDIILERYYIRKKDTGETKVIETIDEVKWGKYQDEEYDWTTMCWLIGINPLPSEVPAYNNPYWDCLDFKWGVIGNIYENPELLEKG